MRLTKPAGVLLQLIGAFLLFVGVFALLRGSVPTGVFISMLGVGLMRVGRIPAFPEHHVPKGR